MIKFTFILENFRVDDNVIVSRICRYMVCLFWVHRRFLGFRSIGQPPRNSDDIWIRVNGREFPDQHTEKRLLKKEYA